MAGKEMEFAIKVGGYLSQKLTTAVGNTTKLLKGLGDTGEQVTEKLKSIQTIDAKQKSWRHRPASCATLTVNYPAQPKSSKHTPGRMRTNRRASPASSRRPRPRSRSC